MKTCPICKAVSFDDAEVCFGCLHRFESDEDAKGISAISESVGNSAIEPISEIMALDEGGMQSEPVQALAEASGGPSVATMAPMPFWDLTVGSSEDGSSIQITVKPRFDACAQAASSRSSNGSGSWT